MKKILKYGIAFIVLIIIFHLLLLLSSLFPSSWIEENVKESSQRLSLEGNLPLFTRYLTVTNNNYTDSIMINACYSIDSTNPVFSYLSVRKNFKEGLTTTQLEDTQGELKSISSTSSQDRYNPVEELSEFLDDRVDTSITYARYWHGYLPFLRILLIFYHITEIRLLLLILFVILLAALFVLLKKKLGLSISFIFTFSLLVYDYFFVSYSLEGAPIFIVTMLACIILLIFIDKIKNIYLYLFIIGCISNFVDFLTVPCISLALPLFIYLLYQKKQEQLCVKDTLKIVFVSMFTWGCGYALTWFSKWVIYDVLYHKNLITSAISQVLYRSTSTNDLTNETIFSTLKSFFIKYIQFLMFFIEIMVMTLFIISKKYKVQFVTSFTNYAKDIAPILLIMLIPIVWYFTLTNHTILHAHFVYKHMLIFLIGTLLCLKKSFVIQKKK